LNGSTSHTEPSPLVAIAAALSSGSDLESLPLRNAPARGECPGVSNFQAVPIFAISGRLVFDHSRQPMFSKFSVACFLFYYLLIYFFMWEGLQLDFNLAALEGFLDGPNGIWRARRGDTVRELEG
jgi:hypothetical protein